MYTKAFLWVLVVFLSTTSLALSQNRTLGLFINTEQAQDGYTLITPSLYNETYLIDNCGFIVNQWRSEYRPGAVAYLLENGQLLRTGAVSGVFQGGGRGGIVELFDWDGDLIWSYRVADENHHQHHDVEYLPNGNILVLAWEKIDAQTAKNAGITRTLSTQGVWPDKIIELQPKGIDDAEIVWEWHVWDHLIQDVDSTISTYGTVVDHPELINMNLDFQGGLSESPDWNHCNSIDYNEELDQIVISSRNFNEFWVIDHSTTTEEAAGHVGGLRGKGGDILYRWGNPQNYNRGNSNDQMLFGQHDVHWIETGENKNKIILFNNGSTRGYSSADIIDPLIDTHGNYSVPDSSPFGPDSLFWTYSKFTGGRDFNAGRTSSADRLPNGNTLITDGPRGLCWEVTDDNNVVWEYQNPVRTLPMEQGTNPTGHSVFRTYKYPKFYPAFNGRDLTPGPPIELNPLESVCNIFTTSTFDNQNQKISTYPNPILDVLNISTQIEGINTISIFNQIGSTVYSKSTNDGSKLINLSHLESGIYFLKITGEKTLQTPIIKIVKQ